MTHVLCLIIAIVALGYAIYLLADWICPEQAAPTPTPNTDQREYESREG